MKLENAMNLPSMVVQPAAGRRPVQNRPPHTARRALRVALYSHDTMGIGHVRRNLLIAQSLVAGPIRTTALVISGCQQALAFAPSANVDLVTLPGIRKNERGGYEPRQLGISLSELRKIRAGIIESSLSGFDPDLFIVDKVPRGALGELDNALCQLKTRGRTRVVLGLRDVLDTPQTTMQEWHRELSDDAIRRFYDAVWVYGDQRVYDTVSEYRFSKDIASKFTFTGYIDQRSRFSDASRCPIASNSSGNCQSDQTVLCVVGGGQDGGLLASCFARARFASNIEPILIMGPFMPETTRREIRELASPQGKLRIMGFSSEADRWIQSADRVVAMAGYNTACSILSFAKPALFVPRVQPRQEQLIRASRFRDMRLAEMIHPEQVTPRAIEQWVMRPDICRPSHGPRVDLGGLTRIGQMALELIGMTNR